MPEIQGSPEEEAIGWTTVLLPPRLGRALDRFIAEEAPGMSRPDALRQALQEWFIGMGYLPHNDRDQDLN
jgi:hypothetical protein